MTANLIRTARLLADVAHTGQVRKYTGAPYIQHCEEVADIVAGIGRRAEVIAAAWLHDVAEDTPFSVDNHITHSCGEEVARLVWWLTDEPGWVANRQTRRVLTKQRLALAPSDVHTIKCADLISNTCDIVEHDRDFARVYLKEKAELLKVLTRAHHSVYLQAESALLIAEEKLAA